MSESTVDDKSTLVQATSHCLNQWWYRSISPYSIAYVSIRPTSSIQFHRASYYRFNSNVAFFQYGLLSRYVKLRVAHASGMPGTFSPPPGVRDPDMHHGTCVTHVPWRMPGSLTSGFLWSWWRGKRSCYSQRVRNPQFTYLVRGPCVQK